MLRIYNTLTRQKEPFETLEPGLVKMYVCGPTVYSDAHVGHAMSVLVFDIVRRYLEYKGYEVRHVMNFTDVDDKIIKRAKEMGIDPLELAENYIREFKEQLEALNVLPATSNPRATQTMKEIMDMVQGLIEKGYAYPAPNGDVYFRVTQDEDYGKLSGRKLEDMQAGARIEVDANKEHPMDFALWKAAKPDEPSWQSPWGQGRPGWHIECSAMNLRELGEQIDIHGGGNDLIFPHHENEIAQSECYTGKPFARYWMHNGMLQLGGEKMSKSLGNLVTIKAFLAEHEGDVMRMLILNGNYRSPLTFTDETIANAERALERLKSALRPAAADASGASASIKAGLDEQAERARTGFEEAMDDDFNTSAALAALFELVRVINSARSAGATADELQPAQDTLRQLAGILGLRLDAARRGGGDADPFIDLLIEVRNQLRQQKQWALSDLIRDRLKELGVVLEDSKEGSAWRWE